MFLSKSGLRKGYSFSPHLFNTVLEDLARASGQGREMKGIHIRRKNVKLPLFTKDMLWNKGNYEDKNIRTNECTQKSHKNQQHLHILISKNL